jgi:hypothetical protein
MLSRGSALALHIQSRQSKMALACGRRTLRSRGLLAPSLLLLALTAAGTWTCAQSGTIDVYESGDVYRDIMYVVELLLACHYCHYCHCFVSLATWAFQPAKSASSTPTCNAKRLVVCVLCVLYVLCVLCVRVCGLARCGELRPRRQYCNPAATTRPHLRGAVPPAGLNAA